MSLVYLAGPIDMVGSGNRAGLAEAREAVKAELSAAGFAAYDPSRPFHEGWRAPREVVALNDAALRASVGMVALLPEGVPTIGTPMEVQQALDAGLPVVVLGGAGSVQLAGLGVPCFSDPAEAVLWLATVADVARDRLRWKPLGKGGRQPTRAHAGDAGWDLYVSEDVMIGAGEFVDVPCGIAVQFPPGVWGMITGRSSTLRRRGLLVAQGIIDQGYRGPLFAGVQNLSGDIREVNRGDRLAQLVLFPLTSEWVALEQVDELDDSSRGERGFGSTGA